MKTGDIMDLNKEIARVERELANLYRKRMGWLESEMQTAKARVESLGGAAATTARSAAGAVAEPVVAKTPKVARKPKAKRAKKRLRMSTEEVEKRLLEAVKSAGSGGLSLKQISDASGVNYQTTAKKLREMTSQFVKKGELKDARYFLKS